MKMFKKIMAVVLTGAMAATMLTGCALGDAMAESAMKSELNRLGKTNHDAVTGDKIETTYEKGTKITVDGKDYDLKEALTAVKKAVKAVDDNGAAANVDAVKAAAVAVPEGRVACVFEVPASAKQAKKWTDTAVELNKVLFANAYLEMNKNGDKATITINYDIVSGIKYKNADGKEVTKDFMVVVAVASGAVA